MSDEKETKCISVEDVRDMAAVYWGEKKYGNHVFRDIFVEGYKQGWDDRNKETPVNIGEEK